MHTMSCLQAQRDLHWHPKFTLLDGLRDSYEKDFGRGTYRKEPDFSVSFKCKGRWTISLQRLPYTPQ